MNEPVADAVRSILDGHVVLSRDLAHAGHYPAVDVLQSVSRLIGDVVSPEVEAAGRRVRRLLAALREKEDLIAIGAYQAGTDPVTDEGLLKRRAIEAFFQQTTDELSTAEQADEILMQLAADPEPVAPEEPLRQAQVARPHVAPGPSAIPPLNLSV